MKLLPYLWIKGKKTNILLLELLSIESKIAYPLDKPEHFYNNIFQYYF